MSRKQSDALDRVIDLVRYLRTHCPWDAAQTPHSLIPYLLEEAHEAADAITAGDDDALRAELGDLLLNVAFQLVLGQERQAFDADEVADTVIDKMQRRHPHLYGLGEKEDWEILKARERQRDAEDDAGLLHDVAPGLDPLSRAHRIQERVAAVGFDWEDATGALEKVAEELEEVRDELRKQHLQKRQPHEKRQRQPTTNRGEEEGGEGLEEELGDLLFAVVNLARLSGTHALTALRGANAKFVRRFQALERLASERGIELQAAELDTMERLWQVVKAAEPEEES